MNFLKCNMKAGRFKAIVIALILCLLFSVTVSSMRISAQSSTMRNIEITKRIYPEAYVLNGEWVYYISLYDFKLYRMSMYGSARELISSDKCSEYGIMLLDNFIYYINEGDGFSLYRVGMDGSEKLRISQKGLKKFYGNFFYLEDHIYYHEYDDTMFKFDTIARGIEKLNSYEADFIKKFNPQSKIYNGVLYYSNPEGIYCMNLDSRTVTKISDANVYGEMMIEDNWIYYINNGDFKLCRVGINGLINEVISVEPVMTIGADYDSGGFYIDNSNVYFTSISEDGNKVLSKFDVASKMKTVVKKGVEHFIINADCIYYIDNMEGGSLYRISKDGTNSRMITKGKFIPYIDADESIVFYMIKSEDGNQPVYGRLFKIRIDGQDKAEIM